MRIRTFATLAGGLALSLGTHAVDLHPGGVYVQGGLAERATYSATVGVLWLWSWRAEGLGGEFSGLTEVYASYWSGRTATGRQGFTQVGLLPMLRYRFSEGRSDWFLEAGIGVSGMDSLYRTNDKQFSSSFNFTDVLGVGRSFGAQRKSEVSVRVTHYSNAGIKKPNPGENFVQLRYAVLF
ncbi:MAG TPA: acyloxyacyl hydrolase [Ramlibacter sp.]|nr:acyloxyacyl hydrolase [Ramlibacter sp.]